MIDARAFAAYRPYSWSVPWWLRTATRVTLAAAALSVIILVGAALTAPRSTSPFRGVDRADRDIISSYSRLAFPSL